MPSDPLVLGFDTSAAHCAAALLAGSRIVFSTAEDMGRGQAERLMPMLEDVLAKSGATWRDLTAIGVGIGPGNFTGIRISVAAARGLALALNIPARGVDSFSAIALGQEDTCLPAVAAPRGQVYLREPGASPRLAPEADMADVSLTFPPAPAQLAEAIVRVAAAGGGSTPPAPLYIRPADAAPSREAPPVILANDA